LGEALGLAVAGGVSSAAEESATGPGSRVSSTAESRDRRVALRRTSASIAVGRGKHCAFRAFPSSSHFQPPTIAGGQVTGGSGSISMNDLTAAMSSTSSFEPAELAFR